MAEMGFEAGLIGELLKLPRATAVDIIRAKGPWKNQTNSEVIQITKDRVKKAIEASAYDLAMEIMERLQEKLSRASLMESLSILETLGRIGG
jgi:hypothetical protein